MKNQKPIKKVALILWIVGGVLLVGALFSIGSNTSAVVVGIVAALILGLVGFIVQRKKTDAPADAPRIDSNKLKVARDFYSKVVGVTFGNEDGTSRQEIIRSCKEGDDLILKPVPTKEYPEAIGVFTNSGKQLGHITAELARELKDKYSSNLMKVTVAGVTGGGDKTYGCNLHIVIYE